MRNMLAFVAALTLTFVGVGWYLNWFTLRDTPAPMGKRSVTVDFNTQKISADVLKAEQKIQQKLAEKARENESPQPARTAQDLSIPSFKINSNIDGALGGKGGSDPDTIFDDK